jgi:hypothetical protein
MRRLLPWGVFKISPTLVPLLRCLHLSAMQMASKNKFEAFSSLNIANGRCMSVSVFVCVIMKCCDAH